MSGRKAGNPPVGISLMPAFFRETTGMLNPKEMENQNSQAASGMEMGSRNSQGLLTTPE
jgi:hypothetical protein